MIIACILGGLAFAGLKIWQNSINNRRRSAVILIDKGLERWLVDFTTMTMYYRHFYKVPHPTDRDLSLNYEIRPRMPWMGCGVHHFTLPQHWEMLVTEESHLRAQSSAVARLRNPSGLSARSRERVRKEIQNDLHELGPKPTWEPIPNWLAWILNSRYGVFTRYQIAYEGGVYENHPGRVEDLERYLTQKWSSACSNGSKGGSRPKRYLKIYGSASSTAGRQLAPKKIGSHAHTV